MKYTIPKGINRPVSNNAVSGLPWIMAISNMNANTDIKNIIIP